MQDNLNRSEPAPDRRSLVEAFTKEFQALVEKYDAQVHRVSVGRDFDESYIIIAGDQNYLHDLVQPDRLRELF
jgi:hypothetical protein